MQEPRPEETDPGIDELSQFDRADQICDAYERACLKGQPAHLDDFLAQVSPCERTNLRRELETIQNYYEQQRSGTKEPSAKSGERETLGAENSTETVDRCDQAPRITRYAISKQLGEGGFGKIYLAHDEQLRRLVAVKVPHDRLLARYKSAGDYLTEARIVAQLDHPHIVPVYDVGSTADCPCYVVSKYVEGCDLATAMKRERPSYRESVALVATVAEALHHAHTQGVVHRDVKPSNILLDSKGHPYVVDFGLALEGEPLEMNAGPQYVGTPQYMSPEQARGEGHRIGACSDIFSLGVVLYELLTGRRPFAGNTQEELLAAISTCQPTLLRQVDEQVPIELEQICHKAMAMCPAERYADAEEFAFDLRQFLTVTSTNLAGGTRLLEPVTELPAKRASSFRSVLIPLSATAAAVISFWAIGTFFKHQDVVDVLASRPVSFQSPDATIVTPQNGAPDDKDSTEGHIWPADAPPAATAPFGIEQARQYQQAWAEYLGVPVEREILMPGGGKLIMVLIPPGEFAMGSDDSERAKFLKHAVGAADQWRMDQIPTEGPQHAVRITQPFWMGRYEVTLGQFREFAKQTNYETEAEREGIGGFGLVDGQWVQDARFVWNGELGFPQSENDPVVFISWNDAVSFGQWLSERDGSTTFGLPTEAQWEYVCRAGTTTAWQSGDHDRDLLDYGWFGGNAGGRMRSVGQLRPNGFGLYDMHGNVWEWCLDCYAADFYSNAPTNDPTGASSGSARVQRGGDWVYGARCCRSSYRSLGGRVTAASAWVSGSQALWRVSRVTPALRV